MPSRSHTHSLNGHSPHNNGQDTFSEPKRSNELHNLITILWSGKWVLLAAVAIAVIVAVLYTRTIPTKYQTSSLILITNNEGSIPEFSRSFQRDSRKLQNELLILQQSSQISDRVAQRLLDLSIHPRTENPIQFIRNSQGDLLSEAMVSRRVRGMIRSGVVSEDVDAIRISSTGLHPYEVQLVTNLFSEEYINHTREKSRESLQASRTFLEAQTEKLKEEVRVAEARIENYMQQEEAIAIDQESSRVINQIVNVESEQRTLDLTIDQMEAQLQAKRSALERLERNLSQQISSDLPQDLSRTQQARAELEMRINRIQQENENLSASPSLRRQVTTLQARSDRLKQQVDSLSQRLVKESLDAGAIGDGTLSRSLIARVVEQRREIQTTEIELDGIRARRDLLDEQLADLNEQLQTIPKQSMQLAQLQRSRRSAESIYGFVQQKLQETRLKEQSEIGYAEIIRSASVGSPIHPDMTGNIILALLLGLTGGAGALLLQRKLDTRIKQPEDLREYGHRLTGVVPSMDSLIDSEFDGEKTITIDGMSLSTSLVMLVSPMSAAAESYRRIRTNLQFARPDKDIQSIVITSSNKGEGKSTTSANLALAMASAGKKTVIVDADLRRPWLHTLFGLEQEPGLAHMLYEDLDLSQFKTDIENLWVVPAGHSVPNPAELLGSHRMRALAEDFRDQFDYVIFDTPPVLLFSDVMGLATQCDGALLVACAGVTDGRAFDHASTLLADVEADVLGNVLNRYNAQSLSAEYGYGYNYAYAEGYRQLTEYYGDALPPSESGLGRVRAWFTNRN